MHYVADMLNMSHMRVYEVATFYTMFKRYVFMIQSPGAFFLCSFVDFVWNHKKKTFKTCNVYKCCLMVWIVVKYIYTKLEIFLLP